MSGDFLTKDIIYVNSFNRDSGDSGDFEINLMDYVKFPNDYDTAALLAFSCPKSYYLINNNNNKFQVNETNGNTFTVIIPVGNYSFNTMATTLTQLLNASSTFTYTVVPNNKTGKYTFVVTGNTIYQPQFIFDIISPYEILGFRVGTYTFSSSQLVTPDIVDFNLTNIIKLCCNFVDKNVLSIIIPNVADFSFINYNEQNPVYASHNLTINNLGNARFWLLDGDDKRLDLNGKDIHFTFVIYKKNNYFDHMLRDKALENEVNRLSNLIKGVSTPLQQQTPLRSTIPLGGNYSL
jgi:hypothetical protein